jgi:hypothetical protein
MQIKPLVKPTRTVISYKDLNYAWYSFVSKGMYMLFFYVHETAFFLSGLWMFRSHNIYLFPNINILMSIIKTRCTLKCTEFKLFSWVYLKIVVLAMLADNYNAFTVISLWAPVLSVSKSFASGSKLELLYIYWHHTLS